MLVARPHSMHTAEPSTPVVDQSVLSELETLGPDVVAEILELFITDAPARLAKLREAVSAQSRDGIVREAHGLKGSALAVGAVRFAMLCAAVEHAAREGRLDDAIARSSGL